MQHAYTNVLLCIHRCIVFAGLTGLDLTHINIPPIIISEHTAPYSIIAHLANIINTVYTLFII